MKSRMLIVASLAMMSALVGACSKSTSRSESSASTTAADKSKDNAAHVEQEHEAARVAIGECLANVERNLDYWEDALSTVSGVAAQCPFAIMKIRHIASLLDSCLAVVSSSKDRGLSQDEFTKNRVNIEDRLRGVQSKLLPDSKLMVLCKKWMAQLMALPVDGPPTTSIPDGRCPTHGQIMRDARNRYNSVCPDMGTCAHKLQIADRKPDPYDKTRCDASVRLGRGNVFISALYRNHGGNWQLEAIN